MLRILRLLVQTGFVALLMYAVYKNEVAIAVVIAMLIIIFEIREGVCDINEHISKEALQIQTFLRSNREAIQNVIDISRSK